VRSRAPLIAVVLTLLLAVVVVLVWGRSIFASVGTVSQADLEDRVAAQYTPDDPGTELSASCGGDLEPEVDATQDCAVQVGADVARVHVVVTEVDGTTVRFDTTPYLPADVLADQIRSSLEGRNVTVDTISCDGELLGVEASTSTCTYTPARESGRLEATVTDVEGLLISFEVKET
jgi:hypothetical protein